MAPPSKQVAGFADAVQDIPDGAVIAFSGFAMPGVPFNLIKALLRAGREAASRWSPTRRAARSSRACPISACWWRTAR